MFCLQKFLAGASVWPGHGHGLDPSLTIIDKNHKVSEKYEHGIHGWNLAKIKQENDLQAGKMSRFYRWF